MSYSTLKLSQSEKSEISEKVSSENLIMHFNNKTQLKSVNTSRLDVLTSFLSIPEQLKGFEDLEMKKIIRNPIVLEIASTNLETMKKNRTRSMSNFRPNFSLILDYDIRKRTKGFTLMFGLDSRTMKILSKEDLMRRVDYIVNNEDLNQKKQFERKRIRSVSLFDGNIEPLNGKNYPIASDVDSVVTERDIKETILNEYLPDLGYSPFRLKSYGSLKNIEKERSPETEKRMYFFTHMVIIKKQKKQANFRKGI
jgi:hypothetical protein